MVVLVPLVVFALMRHLNTRELSLANSPKAKHAVGHVGYCAPLSANGYDFQAGVVVQVHVHGAYHLSVVTVLDLVELCREPWRVMVVHHGYGARHKFVRHAKGVVNQALAHDVAQSLGSVEARAPSLCIVVELA